MAKRIKNIKVLNLYFGDIKECGFGVIRNNNGNFINDFPTHVSLKVGSEYNLINEDTAEEMLVTCTQDAPPSFKSNP